MNFDVQRDLIPRNITLHLIDAFDVMKAKLLAAAEQSELLDETGRVPATPSYSELLQHAADAQALSRDVVQLTVDFARSTHSTNRAGSAVLAHLATAATMSSQAAPYFAETAETALALPRSPGPTDRQYRKNRMVINHATARAYLRRTSESLRDAAKELKIHLELHQHFPAPTPQQSPAPPPPQPSARHR
ncbi:hypothetical protein [Streptomyces sp. TLI_146]|uniref:hypothetical protein n=1 Tax=Streptomyces sp. TLI_146 TaxID=1938858 RepID=UPI000CA9ED6C|nr:hypothetical protein [Streptomyces sp. TLI_146]PKV84303.1 hypothetical protein BX283_1818 [Streptomyces sp. TLI_146]